MWHPIERWQAIFQLCSDGYFPTLGLRLLRGRLLTEVEVNDARRVAVINETLATKYFPKEDPIGQRVELKMLETMREYGLECLAAAGEEAVIRDRHAAWCLALAERAGPALVGTGQMRWYDRLETELDNLRAALGWALDRQDAETAMRIAGAIERFWSSSASSPM